MDRVAWKIAKSSARKTEVDGLSLKVLHLTGESSGSQMIIAAPTGKEIEVGSLFVVLEASVKRKRS